MNIKEKDEKTNDNDSKKSSQKEMEKLRELTSSPNIKKVTPPITTPDNGGNKQYTTRPPYFCINCRIEIKYNQKYKHIKRHTDNSLLKETLETKLSALQTEITNLENDLKKYDLANTEKQKIAASLELLVLKGLIDQ